MTELPPLIDPPRVGRTHTGTRAVSLADATPDRRMRFDAIACFLGDIANDDTDDAGLAEAAWVLRRTALVVHSFPTAREHLTLTTWCSGTGRRWAERRTSIEGSNGGRVEAAALWIHIDATTGRPTPWDDVFASIYGAAADGRTVSSRLSLPREPAEQPPDGTVRNTMPWTFRRADMDPFGHVNNAAYLAVLEEALGDGAPPVPLRVDVEWHRAVVAGTELEAVEDIGPSGVTLWLREGDETIAVIAGAPVP